MYIDNCTYKIRNLSLLSYLFTTFSAQLLATGHNLTLRTNSQNVGK